MSQAIASGQGQEAAMGIVGRMRRYAQEHFKTEELAMSDTAYPARNSHMIEHDAFIERMLDFERDLGRAGSVSAKEIWEFLWRWLREHIQETDKLLGMYICALKRD
jgi:hemerythrin